MLGEDVSSTVASDVDEELGAVDEASPASPVLLCVPVSVVVVVVVPPDDVHAVLATSIDARARRSGGSGGSGGWIGSVMAMVVLGEGRAAAGPRRSRPSTIRSRRRAPRLRERGGYAEPLPRVTGARGRAAPPARAQDHEAGVDGTLRSTLGVELGIAVARWSRRSA